MRIWLCMIAGCLGHVAVESADTSVSDARNVMRQWIETRRVAGEAKQSWASEKELIEASIRMFEREAGDLAGRMESLGAESESVVRERAELEGEKVQLVAASVQMNELATELERRMVELSSRLPRPLQQRIEPWLGRFPEDPQMTRLTAAERMQNLVGLLNEVDRFNGAISVESEIRRNPAGLEVQVETLYLGLAQGYFVGEEGRFAGVTMPSEAGWLEEVRPELGARIQRAIAMYRNQQPAAFIPLPFQAR
jgi:hypothetical protein